MSERTDTSSRFEAIKKTIPSIRFYIFLELSFEKIIFSPLLEEQMPTPSSQTKLNKGSLL